jgi:uncharacterized protein (DUF2384 family)
VNPRYEANALAAVNGCLDLLESWVVTPEEASTLLGIPTTSLSDARAILHSAYGPDVVERAIDIVAIGQALSNLFSEPDKAYGWVKRPNRQYDELTALEFMLRGGARAISQVQRYLFSVLYT